VLAPIRQALLRVNANIMCLQEVQGKAKSRSGLLRKSTPILSSQADFIGGVEWHERVYAKNAVYGDAHHGNAVLSQFSLIESENVNLALSKRASRSLLHTQIEILPAVMVHVICVHFGLFQTEREMQLTKLVKHIQQAVPVNAPLIVAGDFNDWRKRMSDDFAKELQLQEAFHSLYGRYANSFPASRPAFATDRIYFRGLHLANADLFHFKPWTKLSDHLPIFAEFGLLGS